MRKSVLVRIIQLITDIQIKEFRNVILWVIC
nr:MAG TPA: hypothetical protein [Caudoviricetes sp.]